MTHTPAADERKTIRRALVSVFDKTNLGDLAEGLHGAGVEIVSSGGSAKAIADLGIPVTPVDEVTGFPECLNGRVKTLHPRIHAGILADTFNDEHVAALKDLDIAAFELVVVNLYPFEQTVNSGASVPECVEQIDIGGPSMVRAAAKNHNSVAIVTDPTTYAEVLQAVAEGGFTTSERQKMAAAAFAHTAAYDVAVATWMSEQLVQTDPDQFTHWLGQSWQKSASLRYGENPHQNAALYVGRTPGLANAEQLHGKEMSYNNYVDADAAVRAAYDHSDNVTCAVIKHANPCGIAVGADVADAHAKAHACDPVSAFGGIIATNAPVTEAMAETVSDIFTEVVIAPDFDQAALDILTAKKNVRLLKLPAEYAALSARELRPISGGVLVQDRDTLNAVSDTGGDEPSSWELVAGSAADDETLEDLTFAWRSVRAVKSNAILLAADGASVGIGMGQVNRVDSCKLAVDRANNGPEGAERARGAVAASDAFFPFADGLQILIDAGVRAVVQPGGSIRDNEVIDAANAAGITMYFTGTRHFAH